MWTSNTVIRLSWCIGLSTGAWSSILKSPLKPQNQKLTMSLRNDIVSFWFWGYRGDLRIELQAPVAYLSLLLTLATLLVFSWPDPKVIKLFSCSTQLSTKFQLLIKSKISTSKEVSCFKSIICCIYLLGWSGLKVIKLFLCSTRLSTKFQLPIKTKIQTIKEAFCFKSLRYCIYHVNKC